jgi:biopolymer transport protein ExbD
MVKGNIKEADEIDLTPMIDCIFQLLIFFMVIMSTAVVYGVAIKFPPPGSKEESKSKKQEKNIIVYVGADQIEQGHFLIKDGVVKLNGEEIALTKSAIDLEKLTSMSKEQQQQFYAAQLEKWDEEREKAFDYLKDKMQELIEKGYKKDILIVQGDMKTYHGKIMRVIDKGKEIGLDAFSLVPPSK